MKRCIPLILLLCLICPRDIRAEGRRISLVEATELAVLNNFDIQLAKFDYLMKEQDLFEEVSKYDTSLSAGANYIDNQKKKSSIILGSSSTEYDYSLGLSKKLPTGTTLSLDFGLTREWTDSSFVSNNPFYEASAKVSIVQELGKNFFGLKDRAQVKITQYDIENARFTSLDKIEKSIADAQKAYWNLVYAYEALAIEKDMLSKSQKLLDTNLEKLENGLIEKPEVMATEAEVASRQLGVKQAQDNVANAVNELKLLLNIFESGLELVPEETLDSYGYKVDLNQSMKSATENRRDYKRAVNHIESSKIELSIDKNNLWPEINLSASFERNGLDANYNAAFNDITQEDNPEYTYGITVNFPLENTSARAQYEKSKIYKKKKLLELKKLEKEILVEIDSKVRACNLALDTAQERLRISKLQEGKLAGEEKRFKYGRSNTDTLIRYQQDLLDARLAAARAVLDFKIALINLDVAQNTFLKRVWKEPL